MAGIRCFKVECGGFCCGDIPVKNVILYYGFLEVPVCQ